MNLPGFESIAEYLERLRPKLREKIPRLVGELKLLTGGKRKSGKTFSNDVAIRDMINTLRHAGYEIAGDSKGYYWAEKADDLTGPIESLERRAKAIQAVADALRRT